MKTVFRHFIGINYSGAQPEKLETDRPADFFDFAGTENRSAASSKNFQNQKRASLLAWAKSTSR
jgi:hypothetical protein